MKLSELIYELQRVAEVLGEGREVAAYRRCSAFPDAVRVEVTYGLDDEEPVVLRLEFEDEQ